MAMDHIHWVAFLEFQGGDGSSHICKGRVWNMPTGDYKRMLCGAVGSNEYMLRVGEIIDPFDMKEAAERGFCLECARIALEMWLEQLDF